MTVNENRREVAENLRNLTIGRSIHYKEQFFDELAEVVVGFEDYHDFNVVLEKLADLIDRPTCSMEYRPEWSGDEIYPTRAYECSVCGHIVQDGKPDYCPGCGAEVVE